MKVIKSTFFIVLLACFALVSCENEPLEGNFDDESGNGVSSSTGTGVSTGEYWPRAVGNEWNYTSTSGPLSHNMTNTTVINGDAYYKIDNGMGESYLRKSGASYIGLNELNSISMPGYDVSSTQFSQVFIQDDAQVGQEWGNPVTVTYSYTPTGGNPEIPDMTFNLNYKFTMLNRDLIMTVNGVEFSSVIEIGLELVTSGEGITPTTSIHKHFYAKDVGPIKMEVDGITYTLTNYILN